MPLSVTSRAVFYGSAAAVVFLFCFCTAQSSATYFGGPGGFGSRPPTSTPSRRTPPQPPQPQQNQEHLAEWMERHSNLPLDTSSAPLQQAWLPRLPPQTQQRMLDRLLPASRTTYRPRSAAASSSTTRPWRISLCLSVSRSAEPSSSLASLPEDRRRLVARAFRDLREMPGPPAPGHHSTPTVSAASSLTQERGTLSSLLAVEPYLPVRPKKDDTSGASVNIDKQPRQLLQWRDSRPKAAICRADFVVQRRGQGYGGKGHFCLVCFVTPASGDVFWMKTIRPNKIEAI